MTQQSTNQIYEKYKNLTQLFLAIIMTTRGAPAGHSHRIDSNILN